MNYIEQYKQEHIARRARLYGKNLPIVRAAVRPPPPPKWKPPARLATILTLAPVHLKRPSSAVILDLVACAHGLTASSILDKRRTRSFVLARAHAIAMLCEFRRDLSLPQIGRIMGGADHTTILHHRDNWPKTRERIPDQVAAVYEQLDSLPKTPISSDAEPMVG